MHTKLFRGKGRTGGGARAGRVTRPKVTASRREEIARNKSARINPSLYRSKYTLDELRSKSTLDTRPILDRTPSPTKLDKATSPAAPTAGHKSLPPQLEEAGQPKVNNPTPPAAPQPTAPPATLAAAQQQKPFLQAFKDSNVKRGVEVIHKENGDKTDQPKTPPATPAAAQQGKPLLQALKDGNLKRDVEVLSYENDAKYTFSGVTAWVPKTKVWIWKSSRHVFEKRPFGIRIQPAQIFQDDGSSKDGQGAIIQYCTFIQQQSVKEDGSLNEDGLKVYSRIVRINDTDVEEKPCKEIENLLKSAEVPVTITFRTNTPDSSRINAIAIKDKKSGDTLFSVTEKYEAHRAAFADDQYRLSAVKSLQPKNIWEEYTAKGELIESKPTTFDPNKLYVDVPSRRRLTSLERIIRGARQFEELKRSQGLM